MNKKQWGENQKRKKKTQREREGSKYNVLERERFLFVTHPSTQSENMHTNNCWNWKINMRNELKILGKSWKSIQIFACLGDISMNTEEKRNETRRGKRFICDLWLLHISVFFLFAWEKKRKNSSSSSEIYLFFLHYTKYYFPCSFHFTLLV